MRRVAACYAAEGGAATAQRIGVDVKTASAWVKEWVWPRRFPLGMPTVSFVRRARKSPTVMVHDASTGALVGAFQAGQEGFREAAEVATLHRVECVLMEFDVELYEVLEDAGIRTAVHPVTAKRYLSKVLDDAGDSMECALAAEDVSAFGWNARTVGLLRSMAPPRARIKLDMWRDSILDGLETYGQMERPNCAIDARCSQLRMLAVCAVALDGKKGGVSMEGMVSLLKEVGIADDALTALSGPR